jgi:quercetin dioxygenase-like cupin family protein
MWQDHANKNEFLLVIKGELKLKLNTEKEILQEWEVYIVPKNVDNKTVAEKESWILLCLSQMRLNTQGSDKRLDKMEDGRVSI